MNETTVRATLEEEVVGYGVCDSSATACLLDCIWPFPAQTISYND